MRVTQVQPSRRRYPPAFLIVAIASLALTLGAGNAQAQGNAYDYIESGGYSYGSQARWTIRDIGHNPQNVMVSGFTAHALWVGTNGTTFVGPTGATWVELGVTRGWHGFPSLNYYTAHGINYPGVYEEISLNDIPCCVDAPQPEVGTNHLFSIFNSHGERWYYVGIDNVFYYGWWDHVPPSPDYGIGIETTCSGCPGTYVRATPVTSPQWQDAAFGLHTTDNGEFRQAGNISGATQIWCSYPTWFVQALATPDVTC